MMSDKESELLTVGYDDEEEEDWSAAWSDKQPRQQNSSTDIGLHQNHTDYHDASLGDCHSTSTGDVSNDKEPERASATKPLVTRMLLNDNKAGMEGLDREKINNIIYEASKGSKFYENEKKKEEQVNARIKEQREQQERLTPSMIQYGEQEADHLLEQLEQNRDLSHTIVHIDMDAFYAAVEMRDNPVLKQKPMAVGGNSMLSTSNYLARRFGVRAAMPGFIAKKLCPELVIVPTHFDKYKEVSRQVREILCCYDPNMCPMSLDEAYLDFTDHLKKRTSYTERQRMFPKRDATGAGCDCAASLADILDFDSENEIKVAEIEKEHDSKKITTPPDCQDKCKKCGKEVTLTETFGLTTGEAVREMRFRIDQRTQLTASAGIAANTMLAKVCSDKNKPNGQYQIDPTREAVMAFIETLPIRKVSGIGKVTEKMLSALDVVTCQDLYLKRGELYHLYSEISFNYFMRISIAISSTRVERDSERKSMSTERTFREINQPAVLYQKCHEMCQSLADDLQEEQLMGKTVTLKIKLVNFETRTRAQTLRNHTQQAEQIYVAAKELLRVEIQSCSPQPLRLRLMGVRMSNLLPESQASVMYKQHTITGLLKKMQHITPGSADAMPDVKQDQSAVIGYHKSPVKSPKKIATSPEKPRPITSFLSKPSSLGNPVTFSPASPKKKDASIPDADVSDADLQNSVAEHASTSSAHSVHSDHLADLQSQYTCPVCSENMTCKSLHMFNDHIDMCLSRPSQNNNNLLPKDEAEIVTDDAGTGCHSPVLCGVDCPPCKDTAMEVLVCPVCNREQVSRDLEQFNHHMDSCLNRKTIKQLVDQQDQEMADRNKRPADSSMDHPAKKKKKQNGPRTIDSFFH